MAYFFKKENSEFPAGRVEGREKVTGAAKYSAEYNVNGLVYGVFVGSRIASGTITKLNTEKTLQIPGVIDVLSHTNKIKVENLANKDKFSDIWLTLPLFHTNKIYHADQHIALVLAETYEDAVYGASLITAEYNEQTPEVNFKARLNSSELQNLGDERGSFEQWQQLPYIIDEEYRIAMEVHHPMEMHATIAEWTSSNAIKLYVKSQNVNGVQALVSSVFGLPEENIRVISEFVGGGFGAGLRVWPHTIGAIMAAQFVQRPVKVVLNRPKMFTQVGHRPESWQRIKLGADANGKLTGVLHQAAHANASLASHYDNITGITRKVYGFDHVKTEFTRTDLNIPVPIWMRGPGDASGCFAVESAIDQLCYEYNFDPVEFRLKNIAPYQMETGKPWSSHYLNECIERGAEIIGWDQRSEQPGSLQENGWHIGYGHAVGLWNARRSKTSASIELNNKGIMTVRTAMTDIGTGTGQGMLNVAHNQTGMPKNQIKIELGDSALPPAPSQGGSKGMASISAAVVEASSKLKQALAKQVWKLEQNSDLHSTMQFKEHSVIFSGQQPESITYQELFQLLEQDSFKVEATSSPGKEVEDYGFVSSAAHFCKVRVHKSTGRVKVDRFVSVVDGGTIINDKAAANQIIGAVVGGIGMALLEKQDFDTSSGRMIDNDLAGYHLPVNASVPIIEVSFINKPDPHLNPSGAKGIGEVGLIGNAAAISNAIFHATGIRFRDLPVTPDKIIMA